MDALPRIALFGGSFDPVHCGHLSMARRAREELNLDQVRFLPCRVSPHKLEHPPSSPQSRLQMLCLATADLPWAVVDDSELQREGPSYSWLTARDMQTRYPDARLLWIMGSDQWQVLETWEQPHRLAQLVEFIVVSRDGCPRSRPGCTMHPLPHVHPANASQIRRDLMQGVRGHEWLDPKVEAYITDNDLYRSIS